MEKLNLLNTNKVAIITNNLLCNLNASYFARLEKYFMENKWDIENNFNVNKVILSTCGVTNEMYDIIKKALDDLNTIKFPQNDIILMGCQPKTHSLELSGHFTGKIITMGDEAQLDEAISAVIPFEGIESPNVLRANIDNDIKKNNKSDLFSIQIATGCLQRCTFCVIKKVYGPIKSFEIDVIAAKYREALANGYRKISLVGTDTFAYGYDTGKTIVDLLHYLLEIDDNVEFFFGNLHIMWLEQFNDDLLLLCKKGVINFLNIGLQHTHDSMLEKMGRPMKFAPLYKILKNLKKECPKLTIACEIIIGFPGESDQMFNCLIDTLEQDICFSVVSPFIYSDIQSAVSYNHSDKISKEVQLNRWKKMIKTIGLKYPHKAYNLFNSDESKQAKEAYKKQFISDYKFCKNTFVPLNAAYPDMHEKPENV